MKNNTKSKRCVSAFLAGILCLGLTAIPAAAKTAYNDIEEITSHVNLKVPGSLSVSRPSGDITVSAAHYFITGSSNPNEGLTVNGKEVTTRGKRGSFGIYVDIGSGTNTFTFKNGGSTASVNITKGTPSGTVTKVNAVSSMAPSYDAATMSGSTMNLSCTAPSGAVVTATVAGQNVELTQAAATAVDGVAATFKGQMTAPQVNGTKDMGPVTYTMTYNGKTASYTSVGKIFIAGENGRLVVQVKNNAASVYNDSARSAFLSTQRLGAVDYVAEVGANDYRLSSGGWIPKDTVTPLAGNVAVKNTVSSVDGPSFDSDSSGGEIYTLNGTSNPMFRAVQSDNKLAIRFYHTTGLTGRADMVEGSKLFSSVKITEEDGNTTLQFTLKKDAALWGYDVSYHKGVTTIYAKYPPKLGSGSTPLSGVTVVVDAGHGGTDVGAIGFPGTGGAMESNVNLATAVALQKRLRSLGARVVMTRTEEEENPSMNARMTQTQEIHADFFISLHCNSVGFEGNSNTAKGTEVYFFEETSRKLANAVASNVANYTGRTARGAKQSNYRVTLNPYAPSILVEMGFLTNPVEYDDMTSKTGIFKTVNAIGDSVVAVLKAMEK